VLLLAKDALLRTGLIGRPDFGFIERTVIGPNEIRFDRRFL
jgi:hypothetical protein